MLKPFVRKLVSCITLTAFLVLNAGSGYAQAISTAIDLPLPGTMVSVSNPFVPPVLKGISIDPQHPFKFDFVMDTGNSGLKSGPLELESSKLIRYFLASLAIPENELWVNLSPYEKDRIIPDELGTTEMGRDLLAQDYILKQITASLIYPENNTGKEFWANVYQQTFERYGTTDVVVDTFNKVWVVPKKAVVYENGAHAFVVNARLKVMLDADYKALALAEETTAVDNGPHEQSRQILREIVVPLLEKEVNEGKNFAPLRQIYYSLILAKWYKETLKESIINKKYSDRHQVNGVNLADINATREIYDRYLQAFKKGAFNYVKEEYDINTQETLPRKYFSGGFDLAMKTNEFEKNRQLSTADRLAVGEFLVIDGNFAQAASSVDAAQITGLDDIDLAMATQPTTLSTLDESTDNVPGKQANRRKTHSLATEIINLTTWAKKLFHILLEKESISRQDLNDVISQLKHADPLALIMTKVVDKSLILLLRRPGTTSEGTGVKNFNDLFGEEGNNRIIAFIKEESKKILLKNNIISSVKEIITTSYKDTTAGIVANPTPAVINNVIQEITNAVIDFIQTDPALKIKADGLNHASRIMDIGISHVDLGNDANPVDVARQQLLAIMTANMAIHLKRLDNEWLVDENFLFNWDRFGKALEGRAALRRTLRIFIPTIFKSNTSPHLDEDIKKFLRKQMTWADILEKSATDDLFIIPAQFQTENPHAQSETNYNNALEYYNWLALADYMKQWQVDFQKAHLRSQAVITLINTLTSVQNSMTTDTVNRSFPLDADNRTLDDLFQEAWALIKTSPKLPEDPADPDSKVMSKIGSFSQESTQNSGLIVIDVINMSGKNTTHFETILDKIEAILNPNDFTYTTLHQQQKDEIVSLLMLAADPETTKMQSDILAIKKFLASRNIPVSFINIDGGDEIIIGITDTTALTPRHIAVIQQLTQGRVAASAGGIQYYLNQFAKRSAFSIGDKTVQATPDLIAAMAKAAETLAGEGMTKAIKGLPIPDGHFMILDANGNVTKYPVVSGNINADNYTATGEAIGKLTDDAMITDVGGIDLAPSGFTLDKQGQPAGISWSVDNAEMESPPLNGLAPVIIHIRPMNDIMQFLLK